MTKTSEGSGLRFATAEQIEQLEATARAFREGRGAAADTAAEGVYDALVAVVRAEAEGAAEEYARAAEAVSKAHAVIGGAEALLSRLAVVKNRACLVDLAGSWSRLCVPGSIGLEALRYRGRVLDPVWDSRVLAGHDEASVVASEAQAAGEAWFSTLAGILGFDPMQIKRRLEAVDAKRTTNGGRP